MSFKRGFKSQCEKRSVELRKQLSLSPTDPLDARELAGYVGVTIWSLDNIQGLDRKDLNQLTNVDPNSWSAFTLKIGTRHLVVYNSTQSTARVNSVCMHELSHIILCHQLHDAHLSNDGHLIPSNYNKEQEDEADWFAGTLLLPRAVLLDVRERNLSDTEIMDEFLVSADMLRWRFRMTGVDLQLENRRKSGRSA